MEILPNENLSFYQYLLIDKKEFIICFEEKTPALSFYNLETKQKEISVPLFVTPNFSVRWHYAYIFTKDSIMVLSSLMNKFYLIDVDGEKRNEMNFNINNGSFGLLSESNFPFILQKDRIYANIIRKDIRINTKEALKEYYKSPTNIIFKIDSDSLKILKKYGEFPGSYYKETKDYYDYIPSRTMNSKSEVILSFGKDHNLIVYSNSGNFIKEVYCKSKYIDEFKEIDGRRTDDFSYLKKYLAIEPKYEKLIFDPFSNLYYRIVKHRITDYENSDGTVKSILDSKYSIMIINYDFNILDELVFDQKNYVLTALIPTKKGILFPKQEDTLSNKITFDLLKVVKK